MNPPQYTDLSWYDPRLVVRESPIQGKGLFARTLIRAGETVMVWGGVIYTRADLQSGRNLGPFSYSFIEEVVLLAGPGDGTDYYINHSCDPTLWMTGPLTLVARRDIQPGEEITGDYALWEAEAEYRLGPCGCGSPLCRTHITGNDWQLPAVQERYAGHFLPYISRRIARRAAEGAHPGM
jgi:SET domain-containing protein